MTELRDRLQATLGSAYTLGDELGGGGMSRVFVAEDNALGRKVVVKLLSPELAAGISVDRFKREIQMAARLQQANIVPVLAAGESDGLPYYTMPFAEGRSLRDKLHDTGPLSLRDAINVIRDMSRALAYAHKHGIVHRDIKPENVLLSEGAAVVTDFGIAKALSASREEGRVSGGTLTQAGTSLGTPAYMAPEQIAGDPNVDHRADIYALGCVSYELLAGHPPFHGQAPQRLLAAHLTEKPASLGELRPDAPAGLTALVMRCLEKDPVLRPQSATEVLEALEGAISSGSGELAPGEAMLLHRRISLARALSTYGAAAVLVPIIAKASVIAIGLPSWVFPGSIVVMALGLPVILATHFVQNRTRRILLTTPTLTPGGSAVHSTMNTLAMKASPHLTWRRATMGGMISLGVFVFAVAAYMIMRVMGIGPAASLMAAGVLGERERLIVADFKSPASDSTLGPVVTEAIRADLSQSSNLDVVQAIAVREALTRMQRPADARVHFDLARELATREGIKAILDGEVLSLGGGYVISAKLIATQTGQVLASFTGTANDAQSLIQAIGDLGKSVRAKVGESLRTVQRTPPLDQVTTTSLEALRKYAAGARASDVEHNETKAIALLREAVAIDSTFASAWRKLGIVLQNAGLPQAQVDSAFTRAYRHRDRLAFYEQQMTIASYFTGPGLNRDKAVEAFEALVQRDSSDVRIYNNYALLLRSRREFARAEPLYRKVTESDRPIWQAFGGLIDVRLAQGKLAAADSTLVRWEKQLPGTRTTAARSRLLYTKGQADSLAAYLAAVRRDSSPTARRDATVELGNLLTTRGRIREGLVMAREARQANAARGATVSPLADSIAAISADVWFYERRDEGARRLDALLARAPMQGLPVAQRAHGPAAILYARAGRPDRARAVVAQWKADLAQDSVSRWRAQPQVHVAQAEILLAEKRPQDALAEVRASDVLPDGPAGPCARCVLPSIARAFDLAGIADSAIVYFEKYLTSRDYYSLGLDPLWRAGSEKRLGELYEAKGDRQKALSHYLQFVDLWKNADPELQPKVAEVRQRIARLRDTEGK